jgi:hypothetical protein
MAYDLNQSDMDQVILDASLDNLHDIITPEAVGFFPWALGWNILFLLLITLLFHFGVKRYALYQKEAYKRQAEKELKEYAHKSRENAIALLTLAKRVAISAYGREEVANLHDATWWDFMEKHSEVQLPSTLRSEIQALLYSEDFVVDISLYDTLFTLVKRWTETHRVEQNV